MLGGLGHESLQAAGFWLLCNILGGQGERTLEWKRYVRKSKGGDGGGCSIEEQPKRWQSEQLRVK